MIGRNQALSGGNFPPSTVTITSPLYSVIQEQTDLKRAYALKRDQLYTQACDLFMQLAEKNNSVAQIELALMYFGGLGVSQDYEAALFYCKAATETGSTRAINLMGFLYELGLGVPQDYQEAMFFYRMAAEKGNIFAFNHIGMLHEHGFGVLQDYKEAMSCYKTAAQKGSTTAFTLMGMLYQRGLGVPQDFKEAMTCYKNAATSASAGAFNNMGVLHQLGFGVPQDFKKAVMLYRKAGELASTYALFNLALLYRHGLGVEQNEKESQECVNKAVALGDPGKPKSIEEFQQKIFAEALAYLEKEAYAAALTNLLLLAQTNHREAQFQLGLMYMKGLGVKQSDTNTVKYLTDADVGQHQKAAFMLGESYMARSFFRQDKAQALNWYRKASEAGDGDASYRIAELLMGANNKDDVIEIRRYLNLAIIQGHLTAKQTLIAWENSSNLNSSEEQVQIDLGRAYGLKKDQLYTQAFALLKQLAEKNNAEAQNALGVLYENGLGTQQDFEKAMMCYQLAAENGYVNSFNNIGALYQLGLGVLQDFVEAAKCYQKAAEKENVCALFNLALLFRYGLGVEPNEQVAEASVNKAVALGDPTDPKSIDEFLQGRLNTAIACLEEKSYSPALNQLLLLAQTNGSEAHFQLGLMYMKGLGVKQSDANTVKYLTKAYENNHPKSFHRQEKGLALSWYQKASEAGDADASYWLADRLIGTNQKNDADEIRRYLNLAISQGHPTAEQKLIEWENPRSRQFNFGSFSLKKIPGGLKGDGIDDERL
ncbi:MAG: cobalamin biosynthesis protein CobT [Solimicrobium sp.]|nr:cobalamin biosynthesis protein CobT [Solimicrobium sp.]